MVFPNKDYVTFNMTKSQKVEFSFPNKKSKRYG